MATTSKTTKSPAKTVAKTPAAAAAPAEPGAEQQASNENQPADEGSSLFDHCVSVSLAAIIASDPVTVAHHPASNIRFGLKQADHPGNDLAKLDEAAALAIWREKCWDALALDAYPPQIAAITFDNAIAFGSGVAALLLGRALGNIGGQVPSDDMADPKLQDFAQNVMDAAGDDLLLDLLALRIRRAAFSANAASRIADEAKHVIRLARAFT